MDPVLVAIRSLLPDLLDTTKKTTVSTALTIKIRLGQEERIIGKVSCIRALVVVVSNLRVLVALDVGLFINDAKDISAAVVAPERREVEVSLSGSRNGVVVVVLGLCGATEIFVDVTKDEGVDFVRPIPAAGAGESENEKLAVVAFLLLEVGSEEITGPLGSSSKI